MIIKAITASNEMWNKVKNYADSCSWKAGKSLANAMMNNGFKDWERVIVAVDNEKSAVMYSFKNGLYGAMGL